MLRSHRLWLAALPAICVACTFTGLGNYQIATCPVDLGAQTNVASLSSENYLTFSNTTGTDAIGAFVGANPTCVAAVESAVNSAPGLIQNPVVPGICFFGYESLGETLAPQQPYAAPMGGGHAMAVVASTNPSAPCTQGQVWLDYVASPATDNFGSEPTCDAAGSALPAVASLGATTALVAWYRTSLSSRSDPIGSCSTATAAPLVLYSANVNTSNPMVFLAASAPLTTTSISVRPPALVLSPTQPGTVLLAAPNGNDVGVWSIDDTLTGSGPVSIPGLAGARAVSMATDGGDNIAVVAEIGCSPQKITLALGTLSGGFSRTLTIAAANGSPAIQPTVVWVSATPNYSTSPSAWLVSWISVAGGAHALAQWVDTSASPIGGVIDPNVVQTSGGAALSDGNLLAYTSSGFVTASMGCAVQQ
jgi:hypothetical protein